MLFFGIAVISNGKVDETKLKKDYYELIVTVSELFKDHSQAGEQYYNRSFQTESEIADLLDGKVTEKGLHLIVDTLFEEYDDLIVYKQPFQEYLNDTLDFTLTPTRDKYYSTVRDSILNPALKLIPFDVFEIEQQENKIVVEAEKIEVTFYEEGERQFQHHQYARYGYPPSDYISIYLTFVQNNGEYLLEEFNVTSHGM